MLLTGTATEGARCAHGSAGTGARFTAVGGADDGSRLAASKQRSAVSLGEVLRVDCYRQVPRPPLFGSLSLSSDAHARVDALCGHSACLEEAKERHVGVLGQGLEESERPGRSPILGRTLLSPQTRFGAQ